MFSAATNGGASLAQQSDIIAFYGELAQGENPVTTTDMGSGKFAETGFGNSGYIHNM
jgi:Neprosin